MESMFSLMKLIRTLITSNARKLFYERIDNDNYRGHRRTVYGGKPQKHRFTFDAEQGWYFQVTDGLGRLFQLSPKKGTTVL